MERRKILLGSGAALVTLVAGCTSDSDENGDDDDADDHADDADDADDGVDDESDEEPADDPDDIEGVDDESLEPETEAVTVTQVEPNGDQIDVVAEMDSLSDAEVQAGLEAYAAALADGIEDPDTFQDHYDQIHIVGEYDGSYAFEASVETVWLAEYQAGEITADELGAKILETKS